MTKPVPTVRLVIGAILLLAVVSAAIWLARLPGVDAQFPSPSAFDLTIAEPYDEATIFLHDNVNIRVDTHTSPVPSWVEDRFIAGFGNDKYELWVDGAFVKELQGEPPALDRGRYAYTVWIPWETVDPGVHTLMVRGTNKYWNAVSNVVHVNVVDLVSVTGGDPYLPQEGDTLESVAGKFGLSPILLGAANPNIPSLQNPLSPDMPIYIPKAFEPVDTPPQDDIPVGDNGNFTGGDTEPPLKPINKVALWLELGLTKAGFIKDGPPAAPTLFRFKDGCNVTLYIRDNSTNELGFYLYRLDPGSTTFKRIATFGPHTGDKFIEYTDKGLYGRYQYYAAAFNAQGESVDSFMTVDFWDKGCLNPEMAAYKLDQVTFAPKVSADKAYCYFSVQEGYWSRIPEDPNAFLYPTSNGYDLTRELSDLVLSPQNELKFDCWGWQGGMLVNLGTGSTDAGSNAGKPLQVKGDGFAISGGFLPISGGSNLYGKTPNIKPPLDLRNTSVLDTCEKHFPNTGFESWAYAIKCADAVKLKQIILVWEWDPRGGEIFPYEGEEPYVFDISGYRVYEQYPGGKPVMIREIPDPKQMALIIPAESFAFGNPTFFVRAYKGANTSPDSNHFTLMSETSGLATVTIPEKVNPGSYSVTYDKEDCSGFGGTGGIGADLGEELGDRMLVGYKFTYDSGCTWGQFSRGTVTFNLSSIKGPVSNAVLIFTQGKTDASTSFQSCANTLNILVDDERVNIDTGVVWVYPWKYTPYTFLSKYGYPGKVHTVNVTTAVRDWLLGDPNKGFLFIGRDEHFDKRTESCWSLYSDFKLMVTYFISSE